MTTPSIPVRVWCWPGPRATAGVHQTASDEYALVAFLDPMNVVLTVPPFPNGDVVTARFLRELAGAAFEMAAAIDPAHRADGQGRTGVVPDGSVS
jgi:hypothetical protein